MKGNGFSRPPASFMGVTMQMRPTKRWPAVPDCRKTGTPVPKAKAWVTLGWRFQQAQLLIGVQTGRQLGQRSLRNSLILAKRAFRMMLWENVERRMFTVSKHK